MLEEELRILLGAVLERRQRPGSVDATLGRGPVVPCDVDEQRVLPFAHGLDGLDEAGHLGVGVGQEGCEHLHQATGHRLVAVRILVPRRDHVRPLRVDRVGRDHPEVQLSLEDGLAEVIPPLVEEPLEPVQPGIGDVQRGVHRTGCEVAEEGLIRPVRPDLAHPLDGLVGHVLCEVVVVAPHVRRDRGGLVVEVGLELGGLSPGEPVEAVEPEAGGPTVERPRRTQFPLRREMALPEHAGGVAVLAEDLGDRGRLPGNDRVVGREAVGGLGDPPHVHRVVVATGQQGGPRRGTDGRGVELVEPQAVGCDPLQGRRRDRTAERGERAEAHVVQKHDHDVRGALRSTVQLHPHRFAVGGEPADGALVGRCGTGNGSPGLLVHMDHGPSRVDRYWSG